MPAPGPSNPRRIASPSGDLQSHSPEDQDPDPREEDNDDHPEISDEDEESDEDIDSEDELDSGDESDYSPTTDDTIEEDERPSGQVIRLVKSSPAIADLVFQLSVSWCTQPFTNGKADSTILGFISGVFGFTSEGRGYQRPRAYTPTLSALIHLQLLIFLEYARPVQDSLSPRISVRPPQERHTSLQHIRRRYTCLGCLTPIAEFYSLRQYGRRLASSDGPAFFVRWSDDGQTLFFTEYQLSLTSFRELTHHLLEQALVLGGTLMGGWSPPCDLQAIRDLVSQSAPGYSFVNDPRNGLRTAYLQLSSRLCEQGPAPLIECDQWVKHRVWQYLREHENFLAVLLQVFFLCSGQVPRVKTLLSLEARNGPASARGIYVYGGAITYITHSHKAQRSTGQEFHVAHFLPPLVGRLVYYYMVFIRPFVDLLLRQYLHVTTTSYIFASNPFTAQQQVPRLWETGDLTRWLRRSSQSCIGVPLATQVSRQVTVAISEKHLRGLMVPTDVYRDMGPGSQKMPRCTRKPLQEMTEEPNRVSSP
ncbi:hypothetical protein A1O1_04572 [Capronia coronata CBS 617.96]|uniref:Uncharacterized protein n=1 Tax=Capronia coronata CBS 617.96 TaxID=1182541 RepID=W9Y548_9EURO|nr:uncharacterized protein A1O1_04572 [Capronia coronata CBS 617.96]EXJ87648.1 hypothetical protein A1O1_04572 [Capronia coronata CBS 617.96]